MKDDFLIEEKIKDSIF